MILFLVFLLYFVLLFSFQTSLLGLVSVAGVMPDLALIFAVYVATTFQPLRGILLGFAVGFVEDCLSGGILGVHTLSKSLIVFVFSNLKNKIRMEGILPISFFLLVASLFDGLVFYTVTIMLFKTGSPEGFWFPDIMIYAVYNAALAPVLFYMFRKNRTWVLKRFKIKEGMAL